MNRRPRPAFASWVVVARSDLQSIRASPSGVPFPWCSAARGGRALLPWSRCVPRRPTGLGSSPAHPSPHAPRVPAHNGSQGSGVQPNRKSLPGRPACEGPSRPTHGACHLRQCTWSPSTGGDRPGSAEHDGARDQARGGSGPRAPYVRTAPSSRPATLQKIVLNPLAAYGVLGQTVRARRPEGDRRPGAEECVRIRGLNPRRRRAQ